MNQNGQKNQQQRYLPPPMRQQQQTQTNYRPAREELMKQTTHTIQFEQNSQLKMQQMIAIVQDLETKVG